MSGAILSATFGLIVGRMLLVIPLVNRFALPPVYILLMVVFR